jgi:RNA polymerase subunit RPABC4/transcription elongation factor Spt4
MKMCEDCQRINQDDNEKCVECGGDKFKEIVFIEEEE